MVIVKGFNPTNPHLGDAIIATFFWFGAPGGVTGNIIESVDDVLTTVPFTPVGNRYELVEFTTNGSISMATYLATNVQGFPDAGTDPNQILAVRAQLRVPVADHGVLLSAWLGVAGDMAQALGEHRSNSATAIPDPLGGPITADPGAIPVNAGALAYGVSLVAPPAAVQGPAGWTRIANLSDAFMSSDGEYDARFTVSPTGGAAHPQWNWFFTTPGSWTATVLALNPAPPTPTTGNLTVMTSTSGENVPTTDYTVTLDGSNSQSIPPNGSATFTALSPGDHSVELSNVPDNCQVTGDGSSVSVTVVAGETATVTFTVTCSATPPPPPPPPPEDDDDFDDDGRRDDGDDDDDNDGIRDHEDDDDDNDGRRDHEDVDDDNDGIEDDFDSERTHEEQESHVADLGSGEAAKYVLATDLNTISVTAVLANGQGLVMDILNPFGAVIASTLPNVGRAVLRLPGLAAGNYTVRVRNIGATSSASKVTLIRSTPW